MFSEEFKGEFQEYMKGQTEQTHIDIKSKILELAEICCDEGLRYAHEGLNDKSADCYKMGVTLCRLSLNSYDEYDDAEKKLAKCLYLLGKAQNDDQMVWKAFILANPHTDDAFCNTIREASIREYQLTEDSLQILGTPDRDKINEDFFDW